MSDTYTSVLQLLNTAIIKLAEEIKDDLDSKQDIVTNLENRLASLETTLTSVNQTLTEIETRLQTLEGN